MWSRRHLGVLLLAGGLTAACDRLWPGRGPPPYRLLPTAEAAAAKALADLQFVTNKQNFGELGFASLAEVATSQLGEPLTIFEIARDRIRAYVHGTPVEGLLIRSRETLYPVVVQGVVKSSVSIVQEPGGFRPSMLGGPVVMKALALYRRHDGGVSDVVVRIPSLNLLFLGRRKNGDLRLVPVFDIPEIHLLANQDMPAEQVLDQLVPLARAANDQPT
jgi:hypothetical protein